MFRCAEREKIVNASGAPSSLAEYRVRHRPDPAGPTGEICS